MKKIVLCGAFVGLSLSAQDAEKANLDKKMAELKMLAGSFQVLSDQMITGKNVKGAPYSAQAVTETVQVLADGNRITNTSSSTLYRDSQGRERREIGSGGVVRSVFISDPVEAVNYTLQPRSKVAHKNYQTIVLNGLDASAAKLAAERSSTEARTMVMSSSGGGGPMTINFTAQDSTNEAKRDSKMENLGMQVIEGVPAEGTRLTVTIPAGQIGNEQPIVTTSERWYSPDLQVVVMTKRSDPRNGTTTYKLTNVSRSELAHSLFEVPGDYTVQSSQGVRTATGKPEEER